MAKRKFLPEGRCRATCLQLTFTSVAALLLAACTPAPPPSQPAAEPASTEASTSTDAAVCGASAAAGATSSAAHGCATTADANVAAQLNAEPLQTGQYVFRADEGVVSAGFGAPESEFQFVVSCEQPSGKITLMSDHELAPDQVTQLTLLTARGPLHLPARSFNEGLPHVAAELEGGTRYAATAAAHLSETQERIGVAVGEDVRVYPWSAEIARALEGCG